MKPGGVLDEYFSISESLRVCSETGCSFARHFAILSRNVGILIGSLLRASCDSNFNLLPEYWKSGEGELKFKWCSLHFSWNGDLNFNIRDVEFSLYSFNLFKVTSSSNDAISTVFVTISSSCDEISTWIVFSNFKLYFIFNYFLSANVRHILGKCPFFNLKMENSRLFICFLTYF